MKRLFSSQITRYGLSERTGIKPLGFLTNTKKAEWILDNSFPEYSIDRDQATRVVSRPLSLLVAVLVVQERQRPRRPAARFQ